MEQKEINIDNMFEPTMTESINVSVAEKVFEAISIDMNEILGEWSYRLPKGYPTMVDGVFTERAEVEILNQLLEERGLQTLPLPEISLKGPDSKNTDYKEGMVIYFLGLDNASFKAYNDYLSNPTKSIKLPKYKIPQSPEFFKPNDLELIKNGIDYLLQNQATLAISDLKPYIEPFSTAKAIRNMFGQRFGDRGPIFKKLKDDAATAATNFVKREKIQPDKWCPADLFIYGGDPNFNFAGMSLYVGDKSINNTFVIEKQSLKSKKIVGISLKESQARAGKAKSFQDVLTRKDNYATAPTLAPDLRAHISILYHTEEFLKKPEGKLYYLSEVARRLSKIEAQKQTEESIALFKMIQPIVKKAFGDVLGKNNAKKVLDVKTLSTKQLSQLAVAVQSYKQSILKRATSIYNTYRKAFYTEVARLKYKTDSGKSKLESTDPHVLLKKAGCYQIATWFITGLDKGGLAIPKELKSLSKERGAFVALTAYAVGMAGISPNFLKAKGGTTVDGGHIEPFYGSGYLGAVGSDMVVRDTKDFKGFQVEVVTAAYESGEKGAKPKTYYKTVLDFRYSGDTLFIEVGGLNPTAI